jgi:hypothetical protein
MRHDDFDIPFVPLSADALEANLKIMRKGNVILKRWHKLVAEKVEGRYNRTKFRTALFKQDSDCNAVLYGIVIPQSDVEAIFAVKKIETAMYLGHTRLIAKEAAAFSRKSGVSFTDLHQEGSFALLNAIYGYDKEAIKFITYATKCINTRLLNYSNEQRPLSHWTNNEMKLFRDFKEIRKDLSFDEAADSAGLTDKQRASLQSMMIQVYRQSEILNLGEEQRRNVRECKDYSVLGHKAIESEAVLTEAHWAAFNSIGPILDGQDDKWEATVWKAYCESEGQRGWQTEVADKNINPKTQQPYSRRAPFVAMDRIREKILTLYGKLTKMDHAA